MTVTFFNKGAFFPNGEDPVYAYTILCDNGVVFDTMERDYIAPGTRLVLEDDYCMPESGWIHWGCESCSMPYWTRSRPNGSVTCPVCGHKETVPEDAVMLPYEGADESDLAGDEEE